MAYSVCRGMLDWLYRHEYSPGVVDGSSFTIGPGLIHPQVSNPGHLQARPTTTAAFAPDADRQACGTFTRDLRLWGRGQKPPALRPAVTRYGR